MSEAPPGWYTDPNGTGMERWYDGSAWTEQVRGGHGGGHGGGPGGGPAYGASSGSAAYGVATTPDGQPLAGWWRRVGGSVIDSLIAGTVGLAVAWPFLSDVLDAYVQFFEDTIDAAENGAPAPSQADLQSAVLGDLVTASLIALAVNFVYVVGFLAWKQATIGKLVVGTRVRLRERPDLPLGAILLRWVTQHAPQALGVVPFVGLLVNVYFLLDALWPLWDGKKQALHDKAARTNVVLHRP